MSHQNSQQKFLKLMDTYKNLQNTNKMKNKNQVRVNNYDRQKINSFNVKV
jgi:hypothetical protein